MLGRFVDMLVAVESHPAMLIYLDNARSIGPNSQAGQNRGRGLNENLAREILELHTLGVRTVYTQDDVTSFAKIITGWSHCSASQDPARGGEFIFNPRMHEPGTQTVIGKSYARCGLRPGARACSPTLRAIPRPQSMLRTSWRAISLPTTRARAGRAAGQAFPDTEGDLKELAKALVTAPRILGAAARQAQAPGRMDRGASLRASACSPTDMRR